MGKPSPSASPQKPSQPKPRPCKSLSSLPVFWKSPTRQLAPVKRIVRAPRLRTFEAQTAERLKEQEPTRVFFSPLTFFFPFGCSRCSSPHVCFISQLEDEMNLWKRCMATKVTPISPSPPPPPHPPIPLFSQLSAVDLLIFLIYLFI